VAIERDLDEQAWDLMWGNPDMRGRWIFGGPLLGILVSFGWQWLKIGQVKLPSGLWDGIVTLWPVPVIFLAGMLSTYYEAYNLANRSENSIQESRRERDDREEMFRRQQRQWDEEKERQRQAEIAREAFIQREKLNFYTSYPPITEIRMGQSEVAPVTSGSVHKATVYLREPGIAAVRSKAYCTENNVANWLSNGRWMAFLYVGDDVVSVYDLGLKEFVVLSNWFGPRVIERDVIDATRILAPSMDRSFEQFMNGS
jgi:hypothetical protein